MTKFNHLTILLEEVLSRNYHLPKLNDVGNRIINNIKRYESVYYLIIFVVQLSFLLIDKELMIPTLIMTLIPIFALFVNPYIKLFYCQMSIYPSLIIISIIISIYNKCIGLFSIDVSCSFLLIFLHMTSFDSTSFDSTSFGMF